MTSSSRGPVWLDEWRKYVREIARAVSKVLPDAKVYVFGSVVKGEAVGGSDVDILAVSQHTPASNLERAKVKLRIEEEAGLPLYHPFEIYIWWTKKRRNGTTEGLKNSLKPTVFYQTAVAETSNPWSC
ncbi:MAG: nucleotidyltransferase domain-containing protein [Candidatus Caldarchaeum sp.]